MPRTFCLPLCWHKLCLKTSQFRLCGLLLSRKVKGVKVVERSQNLACFHTVTDLDLHFGHASASESRDLTYATVHWLHGARRPEKFIHLLHRCRYCLQVHVVLCRELHFDFVAFHFLLSGTLVVLLLRWL